MSEPQRFGTNHAKAMFYQGLAELGNAVAGDSPLTQRHLENGIWGLNDPPVGNRSGGPTGPDESVLDAHTSAARAETEGARERSAEQSLTVPDAPSPPEIERD